MDTSSLEPYFKQREKMPEAKKVLGPKVYQNETLDQPKKYQEPKISRKMTSEQRSEHTEKDEKTLIKTSVSGMNDRELDLDAERGQTELN